MLRICLKSFTSTNYDQESQKFTRFEKLLLYLQGCHHYILNIPSLGPNEKWMNLLFLIVCPGNALSKKEFSFESHDLVHENSKVKCGNLVR